MLFKITGPQEAVSKFIVGYVLQVASERSRVASLQQTLDTTSQSRAVTVETAVRVAPIFSSIVTCSHYTKLSIGTRWVYGDTGRNKQLA